MTEGKLIWSIVNCAWTLYNRLTALRLEDSDEEGPWPIIKLLGNITLITSSTIIDCFEDELDEYPLIHVYQLLAFTITSAMSIYYTFQYFVPYERYRYMRVLQFCLTSLSVIFFIWRGYYKIAKVVETTSKAQRE